VTGSLGSYVSIKTPPWLRELLSMRGCLLLQSQPDPLLLHPGLWIGLGWRGLLHEREPCGVGTAAAFAAAHSHQHVSLCLHYSGRAATEAEKAAVWLRLEVWKT